MAETLDEVVARMRHVEASLPEPDGVACFNRMYLRVTELVGTRLQDGQFDNGRWATRLAVVFAGLYFDAVRRWPAERERVPRCWRPLLKARGSRGVLPIQFALAGMNAHINHDLALAVVATCEETRVPLEEVKGDYDRVNDVLASVSEQVRHSFLSRDVVAAGRDLTPVVTIVSNWSIEKARDAAWVNALTMTELTRLPTLRRSFLETVDRMVQLAGQGLLLPVAP